MEKFRRPLRGFLALLLALWASVAGADGLYDQPVLRIDPGHHGASLRRADVDAAGRFLVTGADDKTVRVWDAVTGQAIADDPHAAGAQQYRERSMRWPSARMGAW